MDSLFLSSLLLHDLMSSTLRRRFACFSFLNVVEYPIAWSWVKDLIRTFGDNYVCNTRNRMNGIFLNISVSYCMFLHVSVPAILSYIGPLYYRPRKIESRTNVTSPKWLSDLSQA
jgi:hypothetical protein